MNCRSMLRVAPVVCAAVFAVAWFGLPSTSRGAPETVIPLQPTLAHSSAGDSGQDAASGQPDRRDSGWNHFVRWIGHFHPPLTAFPIAMLLGAALAEALRLFFKADWLDGATRWCIIVGGSWFPLIDRNPQTFCDISRARPEDFQKATQRVYHAPESPSRVRVRSLK